MAIPKYHEIMLPLLKKTSDGQEHIFKEIIEDMAKHFEVTPEERKELLPSGQQQIFDNRVGWARTYLKKAGLLSTPRRGTLKITDRGYDVLKEDLTKINSNYLKRFDEFLEFKNTTRDKITDNTETELKDDQTPQERLEIAYSDLRNGLINDLLQQIADCSPFFFEKLVVDLLINMGYGGSRKEAGEAFATSGDEGIDGIIKEDKLGLDIIYIQAKRWKHDSTVGRPEIQKFAGALQGKRAKKGIFITTSRFSSDALAFVQNLDSKIILIDGRQLAEHMIDSNTGVATVNSYSVKKIDLDYFQEE